MTPLVLTRYTTTNALGRGNRSTLEALRARRSGLENCDFEDCRLETFIGRVSGLEEWSIEARLEPFDCRNNRLASLALRQDDFAQAVHDAVKKYGSRRIAVIVGTSTSGMLEAEHAYRSQNPKTKLLPDSFYARARFTHSTFSLADFVRHLFAIDGPAMVISTACSSSAKVFGSASRFIEAGLCDAALVGGVDTLCLNTLYGFSALEVVDQRRCRPCDADRAGLNLGEGAGFALLERVSPNRSAASVMIVGYGESSDGHHMSHPHPTGAGAILAMRRALQRASLTPDSIDYIHLHGTGTRANDSIEDHAVAEVFGCLTPCSSTKGWTGHTLGAAGAVEAVIVAICMENGILPGTLNLQTIDPTFRCNVLQSSVERSPRYAVSNLFGFGGSNCTLIFARS